MAYVNYGGRAYRNGERVYDRCDGVIEASGILSTPVSYPRWLLDFRGGDSSEEMHVILGTGPLYVCLQKDVLVPHRGIVPVWAAGDRDDEAGPAGRSGNCLGDDGEGRPVSFLVDGTSVRATWRDRVLYVIVSEPDGTEWSGWSGYGVGEGHDNGAGDARCDAVLKSLLPATIR